MFRRGHSGVTGSYSTSIQNDTKDEGNLAKWKENPQRNSFIDPEGCRNYVTDLEYEFRYNCSRLVW